VPHLALVITLLCVAHGCGDDSTPSQAAGRGATVRGGTSGAETDPTAGMTSPRRRGTVEECVARPISECLRDGRCHVYGAERNCVATQAFCGTPPDFCGQAVFCALDPGDELWFFRTQCGRPEAILLGWRVTGCHSCSDRDAFDGFDAGS
jgi:hypothetical protein